MNWYKKAQEEESNWQMILSKYGMPAIMGFAALLGIGLLEIRSRAKNNPDKLSRQLDVLQNEHKYEVPSPSPGETNEPVLNTEYIDSAREMIIRHEGKRNKVYLDTKGIPTVGIGFNLNKPGARELLSRLRIQLEDVIEGKRELDDNEINLLFEHDFDEAIVRAKKFLPNFELYPSEVKATLVDMSFNLGNKLYEFKDMKEALINKDYQEASEEMVDSNWYGQVGNRSKELVDLIRSLRR